MKRCLSDKTLMRLLAGDGYAAQRAHLSECGACGDRYRRLERELETVRHVLLHTDEPRALVAARKWSWVPVAAMASLAVTLAVWGHLAVRRPDVPGPASQPLQHEEAAVFLTEVSRAMFSLDDERLATVVPQIQIASVSTDTPDGGADCEWPDWPANAGCDESAHMNRLLNLFEPTDNDL